MFISSFWPRSFHFSLIILLIKILRWLTFNQSSPIFTLNFRVINSVKYCMNNRMCGNKQKTNSTRTDNQLANWKPLDFASIPTANSATSGWIHWMDVRLAAAQIWGTAEKLNRFSKVQCGLEVQLFAKPNVNLSFIF